MKRSWDRGRRSPVMGSIAAMAAVAVVASAPIGCGSWHRAGDPSPRAEVLAAEDVGWPLTPEAGPRHRGAVAAMDLAGHMDLVEVYPPSRGETIILARRHDGRSGRVIWELDLDRAHPPAGVDVAEWKRAIGSDWRSFYDQTEPALVRPAPDLDGDGTRDLVWAGIRPPPHIVREYGTRDLVWAPGIRLPSLLLALSGKDGAELWWFRAVPDEPSRPAAPIPPKENRPEPTQARLIGAPAVTEIDGDGTPDFIATFLKPWREHVPGRANQPAKCWIEAISGRGGRSLWRCPLDTAWLVENGVGKPQLFPVEVARVGDRPTAVAVSGTRVVLIDVKSGTPLWVHRLPVGRESRGVAYDGTEISFDSMAIQGPKFADLDGDGALDVLLLCRGPALTIVTDRRFLEAISLRTRRTLWRCPVTEKYQDRLELESVPGWAPDWPIVTDLDGDGRVEVVLPGLVHQPGDFDDPSLGSGRGVEVREGADGRVRWLRLVQAATRVRPSKTIHHLAIGPVLDGDGRRDVFAASFRSGDAPGQFFVDVDRLSGKDGRSLWRWSTPLPVLSAGGELLSVGSFGPLVWWSAGPGGRPALLIPTFQPWSQDLDHGPPDVIDIVSPQTGQLLQVVSGAVRPLVADFDGDGFEDLGYRLGRGSRPPSVPGMGVAYGQLRALRGTPPGQSAAPRRDSGEPRR